MYKTFHEILGSPFYQAKHNIPLGLTATWFLISLYLALVGTFVFVRSRQTGQEI